MVAVDDQLAGEVGVLPGFVAGEAGPAGGGVVGADLGGAEVEGGVGPVAVKRVPLARACARLRTCAYARACVRARRGGFYIWSLFLVSL